ncbi:MAG: TetR/AcrR family transcriptional regulator [Marinilabiliaceae bacterium]
MEEKKLSIIEKALELFRLYGIRSVTMKDLADESGISKKTLYRYWSNKNELVSEVMEQATDEIRQKLDKEPADEINAIEEFFFRRQEVLKQLSRQNTAIAFDLKKYYPDTFQKVKENRRKILYQAHKLNLNKGIKQGLYRADLDTDFISKLMTGGHVYTFDRLYGIFAEEELLSEEFRQNLFNYHFRGICTEKGLKIFKKLISQSGSNTQP